MVVAYPSSHKTFQTLASNSTRNGSGVSLPPSCQINTRSCPDWLSVGVNPCEVRCLSTLYLPGEAGQTFGFSPLKLMSTTAEQVAIPSVAMLLLCTRLVFRVFWKCKAKVFRHISFLCFSLHFTQYYYYDKTVHFPLSYL